MRGAGCGVRGAGCGVGGGGGGCGVRTAGCGVNKNRKKNKNNKIAKIKRKTKEKSLIQTKIPKKIQEDIIIEQLNS